MSGILKLLQPIEQVTGSIYRIKSLLGSTVSLSASLTGTPKWLIVAISAYEIGYKPFNFVNPAGQGKPTGAMQITSPTMFDTYYFATKYNLVNLGLTEYLQRKMGSAYPRFVNLAVDRKSENTLGSKLLKDSEFNVVMGCSFCGFGFC